jgi:hypothetical protein
MQSARMNLRTFSRYIALAGVDWLAIAALPDVPGQRPRPSYGARAVSALPPYPSSTSGEPAKPPDTRTAPPPKSQDRRVLPAGPVCLALASALAAFRVRVWEVMSTGTAATRGVPAAGGRSCCLSSRRSRSGRFSKQDTKTRRIKNVSESPGPRPPALFRPDWRLSAPAIRNKPRKSWPAASPPLPPRWLPSF